MKKLLPKILPFLDKVVLGGAFQKKAQELPNSPAGEFDKSSLVKAIGGRVILLVLVYLFATGKLTFEQLESLIDSL
ncbi:hypothetical protein EP331_00035 [bacterium]|nr:MAG: hypothetical protein EP331_00035 [bacterium]